MIPSPSPPIPGRWTLRFCLLGGGVAWLLHLVGAWAIAEFGTLGGAVNLTPWLAVLSGALLAIALAATWLSLRLARIYPADTGETLRTFRFCGRFGVVTNGAFAVVIAAQTVPIFYFLGS